MTQFEVDQLQDALRQAKEETQRAVTALCERAERAEAQVSNLQVVVSGHAAIVRALVDKSDKDYAERQAVYSHNVNFANKEASRFQEMLFQERKEVERLKRLVELFEANMEPVVDASSLLRPPRTIPKLQKLFARKSKK